MSANPKQELLDFGRLYTVADSARQLYRALNDCNDQVGILTSAGACSMDRADLRRALDRRDRGVWVEDAMAIASLATGRPAELVAAYFVAPQGYRLADALPPMTDKERADRYESMLRRLPHGDQLVAEALGERR